MSEMYRSTFKLATIQTRNVHVVYPMVAQIITPSTGLLCRYRKQVGDEWSHRSLQTRIRPSEYFTQNQTRLKSRHCYTSVTSFRVRRSRVTVSFYYATSKEAKVMVVVLTFHGDAHVIAPYDTG
ncbi:hypothetical protein TNCV_70041 [Trichonephila clavipes]|nr:hypothetical protein TNCV_70041 [Trichonephila clavipes]